VMLVSFCCVHTVSFFETQIVVLVSFFDMQTVSFLTGSGSDSGSIITGISGSIIIVVT
jgi:hypothetical protein